MAEKFMLLVEDNPDDEILTLHALQENKIVNKVVVTRDGAEALDYLFGAGAHAGRDVSEMPTVILLDLKLPKIDGLEVLRRLRANERTKHIPVIMITSRNTEKHRNLATAAGVDTYLNKPFSEEELLHHIQENMHA